MGGECKLLAYHMTRRDESLLKQDSITFPAQDAITSAVLWCLSRALRSCPAAMSFSSSCTLPSLAALWSAIRSETSQIATKLCQAASSGHVQR